MNESSPIGTGVTLKRLPRESAWVDYVSKAADRSEAALTSLYDESNSLVYGLALRMLGNVEDAEEVTLDVYSQVWRSARSFNAQRGSVTAWIMTLTRTRALDKLRSRASRTRNVDPIPEEFDPPSPGGSPEDETAFSQERRLVLSALSQLPEEQRRALELAYFQGLSHSELASILGEPLGTVKTRIRLGMIKLRELLIPMGPKASA